MRRFLLIVFYAFAFLAFPADGVHSQEDALPQGEEAPPPPPPPPDTDEEDSTPFELKVPPESDLIDSTLYHKRTGMMLMRPGDVSLEFKIGPGFKVSQYAATGKAGMEADVRVLKIMDLSFPVFFGTNFSEFGLIQLTPGVRFAFPMMLDPVQLSGLVMAGFGAYLPIVDGGVAFTDFGMRVGVGLDMLFAPYAGFLFEIFFNQIFMGINRQFQLMNRTSDSEGLFSSTNFPPATLDLFLGIKYVFTDKKIERSIE